MPPHDPPLSATLADRNIETPSGRPLFCPRPELWLIVQRRDRGRLDRLPVKFVVDTGSDVTMIPERFARRQHLVGYDPAAVMVATDTTFHGTLRGRWGTVSTSVGSRSLQLPCFYFSEVIDSPVGCRSCSVGCSAVKPHLTARSCSGAPDSSRSCRCWSNAGG